MENSARHFRGSLFGFSRQDVQSYIVRADLAHREKTERLQAELDAARKELEELRRAMSALQGESGSMAAEEARVRASLEESTRTLTQVRGELQEAEERLTDARSELERLQSQVAELEPAAKSYEQLKDRVAVIELEAHEKAQQTMDRAESGAEEVRGETRAWLAAMLEGYDEMRAAADTLDRQFQAFGAAAAALREADKTANRLREELRR